MAVSVNWGTKVITVPRSDLTPLGGVLYELDTNWLRLQLKDLEDSAEGMVALDTHRHNTEVTVAGVTYARFFEIINGYTLTFSPPDEHYTVLLSGSNNNVFDPSILVIASYSVIGQNSAGLIVTGGGSFPTPTQISTAVWGEAAETGTTTKEALRLILASQVGKLAGADSTTITIRDINDLVDRIVATVDESGNRLSVTTNVT
jgi:hypothetical protein